MCNIMKKQYFTEMDYCITNNSLKIVVISPNSSTAHAYQQCILKLQNNK